MGGSDLQDLYCYAVDLLLAPPVSSIDEVSGVINRLYQNGSTFS